MILFFDTETTGFPDRRQPPDHERQPCVVQLAMLLTDDQGVERASASMLVHPSGKHVSEDAAKVTGITTEIASEFGIAPVAALFLFDRYQQKATTAVAHNIEFDWFMMACMWARFNPAAKATPPDFKGRTRLLRKVCTMRMATPIVKLPATEKMLAAGMNRPKAPKLSECVTHFLAKPWKAPMTPWWTSARAPEFISTCSTKALRHEADRTRKEFS